MPNWKWFPSLRHDENTALHLRWIAILCMVLEGVHGLSKPFNIFSTLRLLFSYLHGLNLCEFNRFWCLWLHLLHSAIVIFKFIWFKPLNFNRFWCLSLHLLYSCESTFTYILPNKLSQYNNLLNRWTLASHIIGADVNLIEMMWRKSPLSPLWETPRRLLLLDLNLSFLECPCLY
jgi:hypothetical protein